MPTSLVANLDIVMHKFLGTKKEYKSRPPVATGAIALPKLPSGLILGSLTELMNGLSSRIL